MSFPLIPDDAPFTPEQRAWLNGFLAGLFSKAPSSATGPAAAAPSRAFTVLTGSQSGTADRLARKVVKELKSKGHTAEILPLGKARHADLAPIDNALFLVSTYGEGDPPESAIPFRDALFSDTAPELKTMRYSVFALGDRHYEHFCQFGIDLDERLQALGATRFLPRVESDVDVDAPFAQWLKDLGPHLTHQHDESNVAIQTARSVAPATVAPASAADPDPLHTRDNPYLAALCERRPLTQNGSSKLTLHLSFALGNSGVAYQAGDACGVIVQNDPVLVAEILSLLPFSSATPVDIARLGAVSVQEALLHHLQPTRLSRKIVQHFAARTGAKELTTLLLPEETGNLEKFMYDRGLIDLLHAYPGSVTEAAELVSILPRLAPRLYSISSSPAAHGREVHCTVAVVRYRSHNRERGGIASTMLCDRVEIGSRLPLYIQPNKKFRLPPADTPMIMIGPGTGIAPFRSFLHERQALGHAGCNWLFFGERSANTDFLYRGELREFVGNGHLTRLDTAFSRDQARKIYVQDRMREQGAELWRWLNDGAQIYVCGDASRMAKDVDNALHEIIAEHSGQGAEAAQEFVAQLHDDRRYHRDVY